jgi:CubicO group peptidase (beta-lactamase class C family)
MNRRNINKLLLAAPVSFFATKTAHGRNTQNAKKLKILLPIGDASHPDYPTLKGTYLSGGAGLSSTVEDYARFLQLFLNEGEFNGARLLSKKTIEIMMMDQLPDLSNEFGLGFGLETSANNYRSPESLGSFSGGGAFSTRYWADPKEKLIGILYTNVYANPYWNISEKFKVLTYQAIAD